MDKTATAEPVIGAPAATATVSTPLAPPVSSVSSGPGTYTVRPTDEAPQEKDVPVVLGRPLSQREIRMIQEVRGILDRSRRARGSGRAQEMRPTTIVVCFNEHGHCQVLEATPVCQHFS